MEVNECCSSERTSGRFFSFVTVEDSPYCKAMRLVVWTIRPFLEPLPSISLSNQSVFLYFFTPFSHTWYTYWCIPIVEKFSGARCPLG